MKKHTKYKGTELGGEEKTEYKAVYDNTCAFLILEKLQQWW